MATILWCYLRSPKFKTPEGDMHSAADLTGQANHLGVTIQADIIKQKLPERNGGYMAVQKAAGESYGKTSKLVYEKLTTDNPIDLVRYQVANCYMGRCGLINSGGESKGASDLAEAGAHRGHQQTRRRHRPDLRQEGFPASDERRRRAFECDSGRLSFGRDNDRLKASVLARDNPVLQRANLINTWLQPGVIDDLLISRVGSSLPNTSLKCGANGM